MTNWKLLAWQCKIQHPSLFVFFDYSAGISHCNYIVGNIFCYNTARSNHNIIPDGNARQNNSSATNPYIISNDNWCRFVFYKIQMIRLL